MARSNKISQLDGAKWARTHQLSVDAVLTPAGHKSVPVVSKGSNFSNRANWTARSFMSSICEWLRLNRNRKPSEYDIRGMLDRANYAYVPEQITIASTPGDINRGTALALVGGAYHEALHSIMSCKRNLSAEEILVPFYERFDLIPDWSRLTGPLLMWGNIIEDIRIERRGNEKFPGMKRKLEELQDFVLRMEEQGREANAHRNTGTNDELSVICGTFRDLGLGYKTPLTKKVLAGYKERSEEAFNFVVTGQLKDLLHKAINLSATDDLGHMWLAMDVVACLVNANKTAKEEPKPEGENSGGQGGPPQEVDQADAYDDEGEEGEGVKVTSKKPPIFKVGDKATLKVGDYKGRTVVVTLAGLPDKVTGVQELEMELCE